MAPTMFVHISDQNNFSFSLIAVDRLRAFMNEDDDISSSTSMCTARVTRQVNKAAHLLLFAEDPLVLRVMTSHGPKPSTLHSIGDIHKDTACVFVDIT